MELHDKIGYKKAIIVDEQMLKELDKCITKYFLSPTYSADLVDDSNISFDSLDELISYDNFGDKTIKYLRINFGYACNMRFEATISSLHSYKYSTSVQYITDSITNSSLFKEEIVRILEKGKRSPFYTFITKFSMFYFLMLLLLSLFFLYGKLFFMGEKMSTNNIPISANFINAQIILTALIFLIAYIFSKVRQKVFPVISYKIGEQTKQIERTDDLISKIFWGVIVAGVVSIVVALLF